MSATITPSVPVSIRRLRRRRIFQTPLLWAAELVWAVGDLAGWVCAKAYRIAGRMRGMAVFPVDRV